MVLQWPIELSCLPQLLAPATRGALSCSRQLGPDLEMLAARTPTPGKKAKAKASGVGRTAVVPTARRMLAVPDVEADRKKAGKRGVKSPPRWAFFLRLSVLFHGFTLTCTLPSRSPPTKGRRSPAASIHALLPPPPLQAATVASGHAVPSAPARSPRGCPRTKSISPFLGGVVGPADHPPDAVAHLGLIRRSPPSGHHHRPERL